MEYEGSFADSLETWTEVYALAQVLGEKDRVQVAFADLMRFLEVPMPVRVWLSTAEV